MLALAIALHLAPMQRAHAQPEMRITQLVHEVWGVDEGLPQSSVYDVVQTRDGYLWLGTQEGLARFDGVRFTLFDRANLDGLRSNEIRALLESRDGALWIGTNGGGVSRLQDGVLTTYTAADGLQSDLVRALHQSQDGAIWIGTIDGGLDRFDGSSFTNYSTANGLPGTVVLAIAEGNDGALYAGTEAGVTRLVDGAFQSPAPDEPIAQSIVWSLYAAPDGDVWVGGSGGLLRIGQNETESFTAADGLCGDTPAAIHQDASGTLWIGTLEGGICRLTDDGFESFSMSDGLSHDRVRALAHDQEGNLWVGTEGGGLNQLRPGKFIPLTTREGLSGEVAFAVLEDREGTLWIGTEGGGLNRIREGHVSHFTTENGLPSNDVYALHEDRQGVLWIGMFGGGVCRFDGRSFDCLSETDGLAGNNVYVVHRDARQRVWIGTDVGLNVLENGRVHAFEADEDLQYGPITAIHEDDDGRIWIGTYGAGIRAIHDEAISALTTGQGLTSDIILALHEDSHGTLWIGTQGGGLCRADAAGVTCATTRDGLFNDNILQILEDDAGFLWLGSNRGVFRIAKSDFDDFASGSSVSIPFTAFGRSDGLAAAEASGGTQPAAWRARDGRLWFSTVMGVASIDPVRIRRNTVPPAVVIERVTTTDTTLAHPASFELGPGHRDLSFAYTALTFAASEGARFAYMLEGYDEHWIEAGGRREAFYTALEPGTYTFRVRAANADGTWNEAGAGVSFRLRPWFYETTWFAVLSGVLLLLAALGIHRLRIRQLKARERELEAVVDERTRDLRLEKEKTEQAKDVIEEQAEKLRELDRFKTRFFANVSHEFRTPLTMIVGPLENALSGGYGPLPDRMRQQVEIMLRNGMRLLRLINQLLDLSKLEAGKMQLQASARNIVPFIDGVVLSCTAFAEQKRIDLAFSTSAAEVRVYYEPDKLEKVFFNLLSNAVKFTPSGGRIAVSLEERPPADSMSDGAVVIHVEDTGRGIPEDELEHVFDRFHQVDGSNTREHEGSGIGLSLVRELVLLHRGTIEVRSEVGRGTVFTVALPKGHAHLDPAERADDVKDGDHLHNAMPELASSAFDYMHADDVALPMSGHATPAEDAPLILVVDDNKDVRDYVAGILDDTYRVSTAGDGVEGMDAAVALLPDCIISDVMMPRMDGNEFCRRVREHDALSHVPFILLTARATHDTLIEGLEGGADDYLAKPFNADELRVRVRNLLTLRSQERELKELNAGLEQKVRDQVDVMLEQRRHYESELIDARDRAEAADRLKSNILDNMNHELRTPLAAILGYASIIKKEAPDTLTEFAIEITNNSRRLMTTLDALLELSRLEAEAGATPAEEVNLVELARMARDQFRSKTQAKRLKLELVVDPAVRRRLASGDGAPDTEDVRVAVRTNPAAIQQALRHVLENAVKFTDNGGVTLTVGYDEGVGFVRITDTGIGIGPEFIPHVFEAFSQESNGLTRTHEGVGLGLTVARRLVDLAGGSIEVESAAQAGTTFTISVPASL